MKWFQIKKSSPGALFHATNYLILTLKTHWNWCEFFFVVAVKFALDFFTYFKVG